MPEAKPGLSHLKAGEVTFLGTDVQRGSTPKVLSVDVGAVHQKVLDDQVVVGGDSDLKGRLYHTVQFTLTLNRRREGDVFLPVLCALSSQARHTQPFSEPTHTRGHVCPERPQCEEPCKWKAVRITLR